MINIRTIINHSNGRVVYRRQRKLRARRSENWSQKWKLPNECQQYCYSWIRELRHDLYFVTDDVVTFLMRIWPYVLIMILNLLMNLLMRVVLTGCCVLVEAFVLLIELLGGGLCGQGPRLVCAFLIFRGSNVDWLTLMVLCGAKCIPYTYSIVFEFINSGRMREALYCHGPRLVCELLIFRRGDIDWCTLLAVCGAKYMPYSFIFEYIDSGRMRQELYRRSKLCIFKHNFICCFMLDGDATFVAGCGEKKRKKVTRASLGNKSMHEKRKRNSTVEVVPFHLSVNDFICISSSINSKCTCQNKDEDGGCLYRNCDGVGDLINQTIMSCRSRFAHLDGEERSSKQFEILRTTLPPRESLGAKNIQSKWEINGQPVCRTTFLYLYNISDYTSRQFIKLVKEKKSGDVNPVKVTSWPDNHVHDYSWNQLERDVFEENVLDGEVDEESIRSAGLKCNDSHMFCHNWLKNYFELCDQSPTGRCTFVNVSEKSEVYQLYAAELKTMTDAVVDLNTFLEIWAKLYPHCVKRPRCEILGIDVT